MTETQMLVGSLSNDLLRVAGMVQRGSEKGAARFFSEAKRWNSKLQDKDLKPYIKKIVLEINASDDHLTQEKAERLLMYSVLLQNYALHDKF